MKNKFLASVADVFIYDQADNLFAYGKTLLDSSITQSIQSSSIFGGKQSQKLFTYKYQKELQIAISDAAFNLEFIALQSNAKFENGMSEYYTTTLVDFAGDTATLPAEVTATSVDVQLPKGGFMKANVIDGSVTVPGLGDSKDVVVSYVTQKAMDTLAISGTKFPTASKVVLNADIFTDEDGKVEELQIVIPKFTPDGALDLQLTHDGVSNTPLAGTSSVDARGNHAYFQLVPVEGAGGTGEAGATSYLELAASPNVISVAVDAQAPALTVYGVRGGVYGVALVQPSEITYTVEDPLVASVDANGIITGLAVGTTIITLTVGNASDIVRVTVTA